MYKSCFKSIILYEKLNFKKPEVYIALCAVYQIEEKKQELA